MSSSDDDDLDDEDFKRYKRASAKAAIKKTPKQATGNSITQF